MTVHLVGYLEFDGGVRARTLCGSTPQYGDQLATCLVAGLSNWCYSCRESWYQAREQEHQQFAQWRKGVREQERLNSVMDAARRLDGSYGGGT